MSDNKLQSVTYKLTAEQVEKLAKYIALAKAAKRDNVNERAESEESAISFVLTFGFDEQIRRFEKQVSDAKAKLQLAAKAAIAEKFIECQGDTKKIEALIAELTKAQK